MAVELRSNVRFCPGQLEDRRRVGKQGKKGGTHRIKGFLPSWLDKPIDGSRTNVWLAAHPGDQTKAICKVCPGVTANRMGKSFSIMEGWTAITSHASGSKHKQYLAEYLEAETDNIR